jgi:hypothetical protein
MAGLVVPGNGPAQSFVDNDSSDDEGQSPRQKMPETQTEYGPARQAYLFYHHPDKPQGSPEIWEKKEVTLKVASKPFAEGTKQGHMQKKKTHFPSPLSPVAWATLTTNTIVYHHHHHV